MLYCRGFSCQIILGYSSIMLTLPSSLIFWLNSHIYHIVSLKSLVICEICNYTAPSQAALARHIRHNHINVQSETHNLYVLAMGEIRK